MNSYANSAHRAVAPHDQGSGQSAWIAFIGCVALAFGLVVYLTDRDASKAAFIPTVAWLAGSHLFGALGGWLPSFVHPFAFSLLTAVTKPSGAPLAYRACVAWWVVNIAFEAGQHPLVSARLAKILRGFIGTGTFQQKLSDYFTLGTFDVGDLVAATAGAAGAAGVLWWANHLRGRDAR